LVKYNLPKLLDKMVNDLAHAKDPNPIPYLINWLTTQGEYLMKTGIASTKSGATAAAKATER
jgi:hypothetical protein